MRDTIRQAYPFYSTLCSLLLAGLGLLSVITSIQRAKRLFESLADIHAVLSARVVAMLKAAAQRPAPAATPNAARCDHACLIVATKLLPLEAFVQGQEPIRSELITTIDAVKQAPQS